MQRTALFPRSALRVGQLLRALAGLRHALHDRLGIQFRRSFVAKAVLTIPTTSALIERLQIDRALRRICGWERRSEVPSEATFSRAFAEFAAPRSAGTYA